MKFKASNWMYPITISNALLGLVLGTVFMASQKIHVILALFILLYGFFFLWATIVYTKQPVYTLNDNILEITRMFKKNKVIDLIKIDKIEEIGNNYLFLHNDKTINGVSSAQIGNKKFVKLVSEIKQVITRHSS